MKLDSYWAFPTLAMIVPWVVAAVAGALCYYLVRHHDDAREPQLIPSGIPFIGHLIGLLRNGSGYYAELSKRYDLPIYTLRVPGGRIYVVTSLRLISAIDRRSKTISFDPYVVQFAKRILIPSQDGVDALKENPDGASGVSGLRKETLRVMHDSLLPGQHLDAMASVAVTTLNEIFFHMDESLSKRQNCVGLFDWTRTMVTRASTDAVYGAEKNPFHDAAVCRGFWAIDDEFPLLALNIFPSLLAPRASRGRKVVFEAMKTYYAAGGHHWASRLIQARYQVNREYGISRTDIEHFDLAVCIGLLANTVPGTAWVLYYVYSDASLLARVRQCIWETTPAQDTNQPIVVSISKVLADSPFLGSLVREVLRIQSTNASGRIVLEDTVLDDGVFLKKGSFVQIPSAEVHKSTSAWGPDASNFDPGRFVKQREVDAANRPPPSAYRTFGSGASVCPGRHFAHVEILTVLIMTVLQYDMRPVDGGRWTMPETKKHVMVSILTPLSDVAVRINRIEGKAKAYRFVWDWQEKGDEGP